MKKARKYFIELLNFDLAKTIVKDWQRISQSDKKIFLFNLVLALFCHGYILTNILINHDGQGGLNHFYLEHVGVGRWFTAFLGFINEQFLLQFPFIAVSMILLALSGLLLAKVLGAQTSLQKILTSAGLISFPAYATGFMYNWISFIYPVATLLAILGISFILKPGIKNLLLGIVLYVLMLGTYQGFLAFGYSLMLVFLIKMIIEAKKNAGFVIKRFVIIGIVSPIIYKLISDWVVVALGKSYHSYQDVDQISGTYIIKHFSKNFFKTYEVLSGFFKGYYFDFPENVFKSLILLLCIGFVILLFKSFKQSKKLLSGLIILILLVFAPPLIFVTQFLNSPIEPLLTFGLIPIIVFFFYIISVHAKKIVFTFSFIPICIVILGFVNRNNIIHLKNHIWTQTSLQLAADVAFRLGALPEFTPKHKIARYGRLSNKKFPVYGNLRDIERHQVMSSPTGFATYGESNTMNGMMHFLGFSYNTVKIAELPQNVLDSVCYMPLYPEDGSVQAFGEYIVVKFSELDEVYWKSSK